MRAITAHHIASARRSGADEGDVSDSNNTMEDDNAWDACVYVASA